MLESLHVKNLALIDEQEVNFSSGMNILSGETGAGKSIIIGSINLALGAKADKDYIRTGAEYALVELIFSLNQRQQEEMKELDLPVEEDGTLSNTFAIICHLRSFRIHHDECHLPVISALHDLLLSCKAAVSS